MKNNFVFFLLFFVFCSEKVVTQGPGSETIAIKGRVVYQNGEPVSGAPVVVRNKNFLSTLPNQMFSKELASFDTITDNDGNFCIRALDTGTYFIEINDQFEQAIILPCNISSITNAVTFPEDTVKPTGTINGNILLSEKSTPAFVRIYGMERMMRIDSTTGRFSIPDMPQGTYNLDVATLSENSKSFLVHSLHVMSDSVTETGTIDLLSNVILDKSIKFILNTTPSGAAVTTDLLNFPILIRLTNENFNFAEALQNGSDVLFSKSDNTFLDFEIEQWNTDLQKAEIWVSVDTVYGNNDSQFIKIYWGGKPTTVTQVSNVFDTSAGFQCVFHFTESLKDTIRDATLNNYYGVYGGMQTRPEVTGQIGTAFDFDGIGDFFELPGTAQSKLHFQENSSYTISAWVYINALDGAYHSVISKGDFRYGLQLHNNNQWELYDFKNNSGWNAVRAPGPEKAWSFIAGVQDQEQMYLYIDGNLVSNQILNVDTTATDIAHNVFIGRMTEMADRFWNGKLDEIRICNVARSGDWIKACYMNQKPDDVLVE